MKIYSIVFLFLFISIAAFAQSNDEAYKILKAKGEICFTFEIMNRQDLKWITKMISIDRVDGKLVKAYANLKEFNAFEQLNIPYTVVSNLVEKNLKVAASIEDLKTWDAYPTYSQYLNLMASFKLNYPNFCRIDTIGKTIGGRLLLAIKISDNVNQKEAEPEVFYSSTIHGNEPSGYVLMLHLIDYLLTNYNTNVKVKKLVDNLEIYINPLANPDGLYIGGDNIVNSAQRSNLNYIDLNRNFPDPQDGLHPDGNVYQPENIAMMKFMNLHNFVFSANFHDGAEVLNYPWDTWYKRHPDDNWFQLVSKNYADTAKLSSSTYMTDITSSGYSNGYDWYSVYGGRQDYMTYYLHGREITIEICKTQMVNPSFLPTLWSYNYRSFLNYIDQALYGIRGIITDNSTSLPLRAKIKILNHDADSSEIYSEKTNGNYHRMIKSGAYDIEFSSPGYISQTIHANLPFDFQTIELNVKLSPLKTSIIDAINPNIDLSVWPIPSRDELYFKFTNLSNSNLSLYVSDISGRNLVSNTYSNISSSPQKINITSLQKGIYLLHIKNNNHSWVRKFIKY